MAIHIPTSFPNVYAKLEEAFALMLQFFGPGQLLSGLLYSYILLGLPLLLFPDASGVVFVWALSARAAAYAISYLWRYIQSRKKGAPSGGDLFLTIPPAGFRPLFPLLAPGDPLIPAPGIRYPASG